MKTVLSWLLMLLCTVLMAQGNSCSNPITLSLDGVARNYTVSSTTGVCVFCTMSGYNGSTGRITYFKFTTNNSAQCVEINVAAGSAITMELDLYDACVAGAPSPVGGLYNHNMCMNSGTGIWAQNLFDNLAANTTYYLKIRTQGGYTGDLQVTAKYYTPPNQNCLGATSISSNVFVSDNNACHTPGTVTPANLCAVTLENTAWYTYVVQATGSSTITIDNIQCNNGNGNSSNGFQIGFFSGSCNALVPITCSSGSGGTVTATATGLTGGTRVYVAIDGYSGSNCSYTIQATNAYPMPVKLKYFSAFRDTEKNLLRWATANEENNAFFEIQRSADGINYVGIGQVDGAISSGIEKQYNFEDIQPLGHSFYRLKQVDVDGKFNYSNVVEVKRSEKIIDIIAITANSDLLDLSIQSQVTARSKLSVYEANGGLVATTSISLIKGNNNIRSLIPQFSRGLYLLELVVSGQKLVKKFTRK